MDTKDTEARGHRKAESLIRRYQKESERWKHRAAELKVEMISIRRSLKNARERARHFREAAEAVRSLSASGRKR
jgi:uncharacterized protein YukE